MAEPFLITLKKLFKHLWKIISIKVWNLFQNVV